MRSRFSTYIGIDITFGPKPVTFVALDQEQQPLAIGEGDYADALAYCAGQMSGALVAVNAAACPNHGRMRRAEVRRNFDPPPLGGKYTALRQAEYELIRAGMDIPETPDSPDKSLPWVRKGFLAVEKLESMGYRPFEGPDEAAGDPPAPCRMRLETNATAGFWSLLHVQPLAAGSLEGRIQRQLVLRDEDLKVPDAMDFFEEVTRFKILKSNLPDKNIFTQAEINAWMAAHTAWVAQNESARIQRYGEPEEGYIFLPTSA